MKKDYTYVSRVSSHYTEDDCVQVMIGFKKYMTMFDKEGILYHYAPNGPININRYLNDDRRFEFPYHDIPVHIGRTFLGNYTFTNQLLNYEEPYVSISDNAIIERMAILDNGEALVINNILPIKRYTINLDRTGLDNLFKKDKDTYILRMAGSACNEDYSFNIATEEDLVSWSRETLKSDLGSFRYFLGSSTFGHEWMTKNVNNIIENISIETIPEVPLNVGDGMVIVKLKDGNISLQVVDEVVFLGPNQYKVVIMDLPLMDKKPTMDTLRMLNIKSTKEPKISRRLNPNINPKQIQENKRLVKRLK